MKEVSDRENTNMVKLAYSVYMPKTCSCFEEIKYKINLCLELAPSFPKMYHITMVQFNVAKIQT